MASQRRPASRKSIAHLPTADSTDLASDDKENIAGDLEALAPSKAASSNTTQRKTRSKSMGPGGVDALKEDAGNRRKTSAAPPKSILKPSIPLSPLKEIPTRKPATPEPKASPSKSPQKHIQSPSKTTTPLASPYSPAKAAESPRGTGIPIPSPSKSPAKLASPSRGSPAQAEFDEDEAKEQRRLQREAIQKQREARRKSMANRRVSFAPEATLHTWDHLEDLQDSTTSSASTDPTRRASALSNTSKSDASMAEEGGEESPSTPPEQAEDDASQISPAYQRDLHQKQQRRRSSSIPPMNFNNPDDALSSSPFSSVSTPGQVMDIDGRSPDGRSNSSPTSDYESSNQSISPSHVDGDGDRDERNAPQQDVDADEDGELSMEMAADDVTAAFQPFVTHAWKPGSSSAKLAIDIGQENLNPFSPAFKHGTSHSHQRTSDVAQTDDNGDVSMDITRAVGGIVQPQASRFVPGRHANPSPKRRQSIRPPRRSSSGSAFGDHTMDFTAAVGGIQSNSDAPTDGSQTDLNEELSMEFTSVFGGIQSKSSRQSLVARPGTINAYSDNNTNRQGAIEEHPATDNRDADGDVVMTTPSKDAALAEQKSQDGELEMDMTKAVGGILSPTRPTGKFQAAGTPLSSPNRPGRDKPQLKSAGTSPNRPMVSASATGSPASTRTLQTQSVRGTPMKCPHTPSEQVTPRPARPTTPGKTPPSKNVTMRHPSPRLLFRHEIQQAKSSPLPDQSKIFKQDAENGQYTPSIVLAPKFSVSRRTSGVGFDKKGLGSPTVAALLDRRTSIGEQADVFMPQAFSSREVRFQDPRLLETEVIREREDDVRRESAQFIIEVEAGAELDEKDVTTSLKEAIGSMTPKKGKQKPRKSLAVGAAKGLLGKRPIELDEDDEEGTPQGLRGREASPVKKIRLQAPPSALETTGRVVRPHHSLGAVNGSEHPRTPTFGSPIKKLTLTSPSHKGHFKDAEALPSAQKPLPILGQSELSDGAEIAAVEEDERIRLQDFLNMTNIRFMELNTTKRRHTAAPSADPTQGHRGYGEERDPSKAFEDSVVAGACTLPMLELYQHSCRELKKYISEGRKIVREIEANTYEENPALFREYLSASPGDRTIMDNQFKNMKTHARLVSKGMWYEWRMKLLDGLRGVLANETEGLGQDSRQLEDDESALLRVLPSLLEENDQLSQECALLQERTNELADCDQNELKSVREQILSIDDQLRQRRQRIDLLRSQSDELDKGIEDAVDAKSETIEAIKEAKRILEEYRGWSVSEVYRYKKNIDALEAEHGWTILTISSTQLTMVYRGELQLFFDLASFAPRSSSTSRSQNENGPISLTYVGDSNERRLPLTTEKRFFLQLMRAHLQCLEQSETGVKDLLYFVSAGWTQALAVTDEIQRLDLESITESSIVGDERLAVSSMVLLPAVKTKIDVVFEIGAVAKDMEVTVKLKMRADVVYGQEYNGDKMKEFLKSKISESLGGLGNWADAVRELRKKLVAQGRKY